MIETSLARPPRTFSLHRANPDGTTTPIEGTETEDRITAIEHGHRLTREQPGSAFTLYEGTTPRDKFNHRAFVLRLAPGAVEAMVSH